ncbi:MAG: N-acetylglucosamine-6-phosphate deacetylase [Candidatus Omnitrophica bacterium]|nr:N-acetylglucosamine-6-phosphate deacetylase [Candidatus Omnitrophota bacterium]
MSNRRWWLGKVVTPAEVIADGAVGIEGEKISYVGQAPNAPRDPRDPVEFVEGWITPGLIDLHVHGAGGRDLMEGTPEAIHAVSRTLTAHGTTAYLATSVVCRELQANRHLEIAAELCRSQSEGAVPLGIHIEGPYVNPARAGLIRQDRIWPPDRQDLSRLLKFTRGTLRMMTMAPELPGALELLPVLSDSNAIGSLGHTEADFTQARAGFKNGIRHVTHLYNAMRGLHHREPGALGAVLVDHGVTVQLIADGVHVHPEILRWTAEVLSPEALVLITDALPSAGLPDGTYAYDGRLYESRNGSAYYKPVPGTGLETDQLFGTTLLLDEMVRRAVRLMKVSFPQAVAMASFNPARTLGVDGTVGSLVSGRQADLVIWDETLQPMETVVRGKTIWSNRRTDAAGMARDGRIHTGRRGPERAAPRYP